MNKKILSKELRDLDITLAEFILPHLQAYRKMKRSGYADSLKSMKEWNKILDKMIIAFQEILSLENVQRWFMRYESKKIKEGLRLFTDYFGSLWD